MKRASEVFKKIRFAKMDPKHEKGPTTSTDDEGHYTVGEKEFQQQVDHIKKRAMQEGENKQMKGEDPCESGYQMIGTKKKGGKEVPNCVPANEEKDEREYGYEGDMAISQLKTIVRHAEHMMGMLKEDTDLPEWVQSKITLATDYMQTAHDYMMGELEEEVEQVDEGVYSQQDIEDRENAANPGMRSPRKKKEPPFEGPYKSTKSVVPGKHGAGYSTAKKLARDAMRKQAAKIKPVKEEISNKAKIVKDIVKKKKEESDDKFQAEPILNSRIQKSDNL